MKVMYQGKEIEIETDIQPGEKELDMITKSNKSTEEKIDLDNTKELSEEELKQIEARKEENV